MDIFTFTYIIIIFQTLKLVITLYASITTITNTVNSNCNRISE